MLFLKGKMELKELFLIYGVSVGYIAAHSIFWTYGLFHSFGLTRVLIVIIPLLAFIAYRGLEWLLCAFHFIHTKLLIGCFIAVIVVFPFIHNKMAINWQKDMSLTSEQSLMHDANSYIMKENLDTLPLYTNAYYYALLSGKIIDDSEQIARMYSLRNKHQKLIPNALILWDSYYAPTDAEIDTTYLQEQFQLKELKRWSNTENDMLILYEQH
ncbi:MAG: hypothetical protein QMC70_07255 [Bacteroidia bacterium]